MQINYNKIEFNLGLVKGKRVLLRLDLNVPIENGEVRDDFRIQSVLPTIRILKEAGAKIIILAHLETEGASSLKPVAKYLNQYFKLNFIESINALALSVAQMRDGDILMLENLRVNPGEKTNDMEFAKKLAICGDFFVNDAFSVSHRSHASIVSLPKLLPSYVGPLFHREISALSVAFNPPHPFAFVLGGAKFDTKMPLVKKFIELADNVILAGALANDIYREWGYEIGTSLVSDVGSDIRSFSRSPKISVPYDVIVKGPRGILRKGSDEVMPDEKIVDAGPASIAAISDLISNSKLVLWNGPFGNYENGFGEATKLFAKEISALETNAILGGGDTVATIRSLGLLDNFSFVSTGGGAMLDFLAKGTLPGLEALKV
jgi:phosphoglycerate kinase